MKYLTFSALFLVVLAAGYSQDTSIQINPDGTHTTVWSDSLTASETITPGNAPVQAEPKRRPATKMLEPATDGKDLPSDRKKEGKKARKKPGFWKWWRKKQ